jgi:hypothetical protein
MSRNGIKISLESPFKVVFLDSWEEKNAADES